MKIISRVQAKEQNLKYYFTGKTCKKGHLDERRVANCVCLTCAKEERLTDTGKHRQKMLARKYYKINKNIPSFKQQQSAAGKKHRAKHKDHYKTLYRQYYIEHKEQHAEYYKTWKIKNKEKVQEYNKIYYKDNIDKFKYTPKYYQQHKTRILKQGSKYRIRHACDIKKRNKQWRTNNASLVTANANHRRTKKLNATPCWLTEQDLQSILSIYQQAAHLTKTTKIAHVVDHYYPLRGKQVSGLHCPHNLVVITKKENAYKGNKHPDNFYRLGNVRT